MRRNPVKRWREVPTEIARPEEDLGMSNWITNTVTIGSNACERTYSIGASLSQNLGGYRCSTQLAYYHMHVRNQPKSRFPEFSTECTLLRLRTAEATGICGGETTHTHVCVRKRREHENDANLLQQVRHSLCILQWSA